MSKSTRSVLNSYKKQYNKSQNAWKKKNGFPTQKKTAFYDKYYTAPKPPKVVNSKPINTKYYMKSEQPTDHSNTQSNNGCYIATCIYGSYDCPEVWTLRRYRDYVLDETWHGRAFVRLYYALSPTLVRLFGKKLWFRAFWKKRLDVWVSILNQSGVACTKYIDKY